MVDGGAAGRTQGRPVASSTPTRVVRCIRASAHDRSTAGREGARTREQEAEARRRADPGGDRPRGVPHRRRARPRLAVGVGVGLAELVRSSAIRILDLVLLVKDADGVVAAIDPQSVDAIRDLPVEVGSMLSEHDVELAALALRPSSAAVVLVSEDRWAQPLSVAAQHAGGQILAGERIPAARVESALAGPARHRDEGELSMTDAMSSVDNGPTCWRDHRAASACTTTRGARCSSTRPPSWRQLADLLGPRAADPGRVRPPEGEGAPPVRATTRPDRVPPVGRSA